MDAAARRALLRSFLLSTTVLPDATICAVDAGPRTRLCTFEVVVAAI